jgi:glycosyltransferase involved in cell wall biosynthesis
MVEDRVIRVLYDEQIFLLQKHGGISKYFVELINQFTDHPELGVEPILVTTKTRNEYLKNQVDSSLQLTTTLNQVFLSIMSGLFRGRTKPKGIDLVHHTFYLPGYLSRFPGLPRVSTLFDMIPEFAERGNRLWNPHFRKKAYLLKSEAVVSISDSSTKDMISQYGYKLPVQTTHLGVSSEFMPGLPPIEQLPKNYFLFVGNRAGYKNARIAMSAFSTVSAQFGDVHLLFCGGGLLNKDELSEIGRLGISHKVVQREFASSELPSLYSNATALLYPTKYEGFGLPLVEAMASGVPVLASETPINLEIAGSAASYFQPDSSSELAHLLSEALRESLELKSKIREGIARAETFNWYRCAELTANVYRDVLSQGSRTH